jgi:hypothetical protein
MPDALHSRAEAQLGFGSPSPGSKASDDNQRSGEEPRLTTAGEPPPEPTPQEHERPPGLFVSDEHEADCSRFLEEIKDVVRRRTEAGLGWKQ